MEWPTRASSPFREQPYLDSIALDALFFSQPSAGMELGSIPPIPETHPNAHIAPPDRPSHGTYPHLYYTTTAPTAGGNGAIPEPGTMAVASQAHSAYPPVTVGQPSAFHVPVSQPQQHQPVALANMNGGYRSDGTMVHQRHRGTTNTASRPSLHTPRIFECKWQGCHGTARFHREGDLFRHIKTIHVSPHAYPCPESHCRKSFGRRDHLREHQRRRHGM